MKNNKRIYLISTVLLTVMMIGSVIFYLTQPEEVKLELARLGFPEWLLYHIAFAKAVGVTFLWVKKWPSITEWAYAGLAFEFFLAFSAHSYAGDGEIGGALAALILLFTSYTSGRMLEKK